MKRSEQKPFRKTSTEASGGTPREAYRRTFARTPNIIFGAKLGRTFGRGLRGNSGGTISGISGEPLSGTSGVAL